MTRPFGNLVNEREVNIVRVDAQVIDEPIGWTKRQPASAKGDVRLQRVPNRAHDPRIERFRTAVETPSECADVFARALSGQRAKVPIAQPVSEDHPHDESANANRYLNGPHDPHGN